MKMSLKFSNKAALKAAETYLINQNAPFRINEEAGNKLEFYTIRWWYRAMREVSTMLENEGQGTVELDFA